MTTFFKELFEYNNHCNQKLADVFLAQADITSAKSFTLYSHLLNAHHIWISRIEQKQNSYEVWQIHQPQALKQIDLKNYNDTLVIIDSFDLNLNIQYSNTKGQIFHNKIRDILFHIINHSTYHRGQIALEFRQKGMEPLVTDYVHYKR